MHRNRNIPNMQYICMFPMNGHQKLHFFSSKVNLYTLLLDIQIIPPTTPTVFLGQNATFVCEISDQLGYFNPMWLGPGGTAISIDTGNVVLAVVEIVDSII